MRRNDVSTGGGSRHSSRRLWRARKSGELIAICLPMLLVAALTTVVVSLPAQAAPTWLPDISDLSATGQNASTPQVATAMGAAAAAPFSSLLSDDYEGAVRWNPNSTGWAISTTRAFGGAHSAHAPSSPNNLMIYGPFDLSAATAATLSFQLWYYAPKASFPPGTPNTAGSFLGGYSTDGSWFTFPYQWSGSTSGEWWPTTFDLGGWSLLGKPQVWIALGTTTLGSALYSEGAYVDDLNLTVTIPDTVLRLTIAATLSLSNQADGDDVAMVNAPNAAHGAVVKLFRVRSDGSRALLDTKTANRFGNARFVHNDTNGNRFTKYQANVGATVRTYADWTPQRSIR